MGWLPGPVPAGADLALHPPHLQRCPPCCLAVATPPQTPARSPHCTFHACVEVLVKHGLRSSQQMREHFKALLGFALPQNRRYIRDVIERFEAASRAAQAGVGSGSSRSAGGAAQAAQGSSGGAAARAPLSSSGGGAAGQATDTKRCTECGTVKGKLLRCSGCKQLWYCSRECQLANWPAHKAACRAVQHTAKQAAA